MCAACCLKFEWVHCIPSLQPPSAINTDITSGSDLHHDSPKASWRNSLLVKALELAMVRLACQYAVWFRHRLISSWGAALEMARSEFTMQIPNAGRWNYWWKGDVGWSLNMMPSEGRPWIACYFLAWCLMRVLKAVGALKSLEILNFGGKTNHKF